MYKHSVPYKRKGLFILITLPMVIMYALIGYHLHSVSPFTLFIYCLFFALTILFQGYNCINWECPHVGKFCPGVGGFCVISSPIAKLLIIFKVKRNPKTYKALCNFAWTSFLGIILYPVYFIFKLSVMHLIVYLIIIAIYFLCMMLFICPSCGAKNACPGGQMSSKITRRNISP